LFSVFVVLNGFGILRILLTDTLPCRAGTFSAAARNRGIPNHLFKPVEGFSAAHLVLLNWAVEVSVGKSVCVLFQSLDEDGICWRWAEFYKRWPELAGVPYLFVFCFEQTSSKGRWGDFYSKSNGSCYVCYNWLR